MRASFCVDVLLNRFIDAKYVFSSDVDSYEDGEGQALRDTLNRCEIYWTNKWSLLTLGKYVYIAKTGDVIPNSNNVVLVKCQKKKWKKGISQIRMNKAY